jgi:hypothetical protein
MRGEVDQSKDIEHHADAWIKRQPSSFDGWITPTLAAARNKAQSHMPPDRIFGGFLFFNNK